MRSIQRSRRRRPVEQRASLLTPPSWPVRYPAASQVSCLGFSHHAKILATGSAHTFGLRLTTLRQRCCRGWLPTNPVMHHKQNSLGMCHSIVSDNSIAVRRGLVFLRNGVAKHVCLRHLAFDRNSGFEWNLGCMKKIATKVGASPQPHPVSQSPISGKGDEWIRNTCSLSQRSQWYCC